MTHRLDQRQRRRTWIVGLALLAAGILLLGALYDREQRAEARKERIAQINAVSCGNYDTLYRLITGTPVTRREVFEALGFSSEQIDQINLETERSREVQLTILGSRPDTCPPPEIVR
jgi:hypothetical protein